MTSKERVMTMLNHQRPDRIPKFDGFWAEYLGINRLTDFMIML